VPGDRPIAHALVGRGRALCSSSNAGSCNPTNAFWLSDVPVDATDDGYTYTLSESNIDSIGVAPGDPVYWHLRANALAWLTRPLRLADADDGPGEEPPDEGPPDAPPPALQAPGFTLPQMTVAPGESRCFDVALQLAPDRDPDENVELFVQKLTGPGVSVGPFGWKDPRILDDGAAVDLAGSLVFRFANGQALDAETGAGLGPLQFCIYAREDATLGSRFQNVPAWAEKPATTRSRSESDEASPGLLDIEHLSLELGFEARYERRETITDRDGPAYGQGESASSTPGIAFAVAEGGGGDPPPGGGGDPDPVDTSTWDALAPAFSASACVNCHAAATSDGGFVQLTSHHESIGSPAPASDPGACTGCHTDELLPDGPDFHAVPWQAAPAGLDLRDMSESTMCQNTRSGGNLAADGKDHLLHDPLVIWAVQGGQLPLGAGNASAAYSSLSAWTQAVEAWDDAGMPCP